MGTTSAPQLAETLIQLVLRAHCAEALLQTDEDWRALGLIASRMLFWCGGAIYGCRCDGDEMRFALQVAGAPLGTMAHHISGAYAIHLHRSRRIDGGIFKHYIALPVEEWYLDELVLWLHRSESRRRIWTADNAYISQHSLPWISTERVLSSLSVGAPGPATYLRRKRDSISPQLIERFTRRPQRGCQPQLPDDSAAESDAANHGVRRARPSIEAIARLVASICKVSIDDMLADTRKRAVSKARVIATVLATRNGFTAASAARLFNRSRSTLVEQVEYYRASQPDMFLEAQQLLDAALADERE